MCLVWFFKITLNGRIALKSAPSAEATARWVPHAPVLRVGFYDLFNRQTQRLDRIDRDYKLFSPRVRTSALAGAGSTTGGLARSEAASRLCLRP